MGFKRDRHLLTEHTLTQYIEHNTYLNDIFHWNHPDIICDILHSELNVIINAIAPKKKIQLSKKYNPFITKNINSLIKQKANLIVIAKTTNNIEDYLDFKNCHNAINKK